MVGYGETRLGASVANRLRIRLVRRLLADGSTVPAPRLLALLAVRLREIEAAVADGILKTWRSVAQLVPLAVCSVVVSPALAAFALLGVVPFAVCLAMLRTRARHASDVSQTLVQRLEEGVDELVRNTDLFRTYGAGERVITAVDRAGVAASVSAARVDMNRAALSGANEVVAALAVIGVAALSSRLGRSDITGALVPFAAVFFMAYRPLRDLGDARGRVSRGVVAYEAIEQATEGPKASDAAVRPSPWSAERPPLVELSNFGGLDRGRTLTVTIAPGEVVGLLGRTGSGKTTLFRALLGLEAARGELRIGGEPLVGAGVGPTCRPFAWVPQDAPLVTGTIAENVALLGGDESVAEEALRAVGAERLVPMARTELVGPGGRPLSGGERRQVSLARALATKLPVLLLDEPTEGLDADASSAVLRAIAALGGRRTVIVATHRMDVLAVTDRVVRLLDEGDARESELSEEAGVVLEQDADIRDAVAKERDALDA
jgi:ABC-type transport system involved in cytochrome bd biosynthesis fused ATPase/permease subunit